MITNSVDARVSPDHHLLLTLPQNFSRQGAGTSLADHACLG
jgi:hypothetical protein